MSISIPNDRSACAYIRSSASGLRQREALIEQSRRISAFCARGQHVLACTVIDTGAAGDQPNLERLLTCAASTDRFFDQIIVCAASRISRDPATLESIKTRLAAANVQLVVLDASPGLAPTPMVAEALRQEVAPVRSRLAGAAPLRGSTN